MTSNPKTLVLLTLDMWIYKTKEFYKPNAKNHPLNAIPTNFFALSDN